MARYSMDFGGSTVDLLRWENDRIVASSSYERSDLILDSLEHFIEGQSLSLEGIEEIRITGGKSHTYSVSIQGVPVVRVDEIQAIGRGGRWLLQQTEGEGDSLTVSMGTGTCMVAVRGDQTEHVGGTGVGGGTFLTLCSKLLSEGDPQRLIPLFKSGDRRKVDLSVGEIVGRSIGRISPDITASNLGKVVTSAEEIDFSKADLAAGIANLIGQTIATAAVFAARAENLDTIILTGKLTRIEPIVDIIFEVGRLYGRRILLPKQAEFVAAIGAAM